MVGRQSFVISQQEADHFVNQSWEFNIETLDQSADPGDDDDGGENEDFD